MEFIREAYTREAILDSAKEFFSIWPPQSIQSDNSGHIRALLPQYADTLDDLAKRTLDAAKSVERNSQALNQRYSLLIKRELRECLEGNWPGENGESQSTGMKYMEFLGLNATLSLQYRIQTLEMNIPFNIQVHAHPTSRKDRSVATDTVWNLTMGDGRCYQWQGGKEHGEEDKLQREFPNVSALSASIREYLDDNNPLNHTRPISKADLLRMASSRQTPSVEPVPAGDVTQGVDQRSEIFTRYAKFRGGHVISSLGPGKKH